MAEMSIQEIIKNEFKNNPIPGVKDANEYAYHLNELLQKDYKLIRSGNYLFVYKEAGDGVVDVDIIAGEKSDKDLINNLLKALLEMRQAGYKEADIPFDDKGAINFFRKLPILPVSFEQAEDGYVAKVKLT